MTGTKFDWGSLADLIEDVIMFHQHKTASHPDDLVTQIRSVKPPLRSRAVTPEKIMTAVRNDIALAITNNVEPRFEFQRPYASGNEFISLRRTKAYRRGSIMTSSSVVNGPTRSVPAVPPSTKATGSQESRRSAARLAIDQAKPYEFEALVERLLMAMGMEQVQHTPASRDGGIDVRGVLVIEGVIRVNLAVQVKKHASNVHSPDVQKLRGSLHVHETGLFIVSGSFSRGAIEEANQPGKTPISLIDGTEFTRLLIKHGVFPH